MAKTAELAESDYFQKSIMRKWLENISVVVSIKTQQITSFLCFSWLGKSILSRLNKGFSQSSWDFQSKNLTNYINIYVLVRVLRVFYPTK